MEKVLCVRDQGTNTVDALVHQDTKAQTRYCQDMNMAPTGRQQGVSRASAGRRQGARLAPGGRRQGANRASTGRQGHQYWHLCQKTIQGPKYRIHIFLCNLLNYFIFQYFISVHYISQVRFYRD